MNNQGLRKIQQALAYVVGDSRQFSIEKRLFHALALVNGVANIAGAIPSAGSFANPIIYLLHFVTGAAFLALYFASRQNPKKPEPYWLFLGLIGVFLSINVLGNAGSMGGAHYYLIMATVIAAVMSGTFVRAMGGAAMFAIIAAAMFYIELNHPGLITAHESENARLEDVAGNFIFVLFFTALLIYILVWELRLSRLHYEQVLDEHLPPEIAEEIKLHHETSARGFREATALSIGLPSFAPRNTTDDPEKILVEFNELLTAIDASVEKHGLRRVKLLGGSYLAVGGVPEGNSTHALDAVMTAIEIKNALKAVNEARFLELRPALTVTIGIHTGNAVAGLLGSGNKSYNVWGDAPAIAEKVRQRAPDGAVAISGESAEPIKDIFDLEIIDAKVTTADEKEIPISSISGYSEKHQGGDALTPNDLVLVKRDSFKQ